METKICTCCKEEKDISFFEFRKERGYHKTQCRKCCNIKSCYRKKHPNPILPYVAPSEKVCLVCKKNKKISEYRTRESKSKRHRNQCNSCLQNRELKNRSKRKIERRKYLYDYLKINHCVDCGESRPYLLEFDHIDKSKKKCCISELVGGGRSLQTIKNEIDKCVVRCMSCHRLKTSKSHPNRNLKAIAFRKEILADKKCILCGETNDELLDFDHIDRTKKTNSVARLLKCKGRDYVINEIETNCRILCCKCHRIETAKQFGWWWTKLEGIEV